MNEKILYDFKNYTGEEFSFTKNNLHIYCEKVTNENIEGLINILKHPPEKIDRVHFNNNFNENVSEYNIQKILLNVIHYNSELLSLNFNNCENMNDSLLSYIMFTVKNLKNMKILGFESCKINDNHLKIIVDGLKDNKTLLGLMLRKNNITSQGGFYIAEFLNNNTTIRQLFLGENNIKDKGLKCLIEVITTKNKNITSLDFSNNNFILEDFNTLINYLKSDPILSSLDISGNKLDLKSSINLGAAVSTMKNLKCLNLSKMGIISDNIPNLFKTCKLEEIILDENVLEGIGLLMLGKSLAANKNLKKLSLKSTQFSSIGLISLLTTIKNLKDLKEIHLENNVIEDTCLPILKQTAENPNIKIYISKDKVNPAVFTEEALGKESNIVMV